MASFPVPNAFEVLCEQYTKRLPARLEDLAGPAHGWACTAPSWPRASART
ncbi:hypothetical protein [Streptomyces sp. NPDC017988]